MEKNRVRPITVVLCLILLVGTSLLFYGFRKPAPQPVVESVSKTQNNQPSVPSVEVSANIAGSEAMSYQLFVGANPILNRKQVFSPPTGSVVVTSETHLQKLIGEAKSRSTTTQ